MAVLKGSVIGELSGKLGNLAARIIDGRTILAQRPVSFNVSYIPTLVEIRKKFAVTGTFVKNLITLSIVYEIWMKVKESGMSAFNYAFKQNFAESSADKPTVDNIITPADGFAFNVTEAIVDADSVKVVIAPLNTTMIGDDTVEADIVPNGLLCYYDPLDVEDAPFAITTITKAPVIFDLLNPITFDIPLNVVQQAMAAKYQHSILYFAMATRNADEELIQYSYTYSKNT